MTLDVIVKMNNAAYYMYAGKPTSSLQTDCFYELLLDEACLFSGTCTSFEVFKTTPQTPMKCIHEPHYVWALNSKAKESI